jgi:hypothetical protein
MKKILALTLILSVAAFAASSFIEGSEGAVSISTGFSPLNPDVLYDTDYDVNDCTAALATYATNGWVCSDDFIIADDGEVESIKWYVIEYSFGGITDCNIVFLDHGAPGPGSELDNVSGTFEKSATGDYLFGAYAVYEYVYTLDTPWAFTGGEHYWWYADLSSGGYYQLSRPNEYDDEMYFSEDGGSTWTASDDEWTYGPLDLQWVLEGTLGGGDDVPPAVGDVSPADGAVDVPLDSDIVFHATDDNSGVDTATIDFTAEDTTLSGGALTMVSPLAEISGTLDVDDTDPLDVICTFTADADLPMDTITCTVAGTLADNAGNTMGSDYVWSFDTLGSNVEPASWGQIKSL